MGTHASKPARAHRRPPLPHWTKGPGFCRWCGKACEPSRRWHSHCVEAYKIAAWPASARFAVWVKDGGVCQGCRRDLAAETAAHEWNREGKSANHFRKVLCNWGPAWQCDHIRPLIEGDPNDLTLWTVANLRVLCIPCHKGETKALAARRAKARKEMAP